MNNFRVFSLIACFLVAESKIDIPSKSNLQEHNSIKDSKFWGSWFDPFDLSSKRKAAESEAIAKAEAAKAAAAKAEADAAMARASSAYSYGSRSMSSSSSSRKFGF